MPLMSVISAHYLLDAIGPIKIVSLLALTLKCSLRFSSRNAIPVPHSCLPPLVLLDQKQCLFVAVWSGGVCNRDLLLIKLLRG